jgi:hypothetical protein
MAARSGAIALLLAIEIAIVALAVYSFTGFHGFGSGWGGMHAVNYTVTPIAPLAAGSSPHVVIDDRDDRVIVTTSNDGLVHVTDQSHAQGYVWGPSADRPKLVVTRTGDGVSIVRNAQDELQVRWFGFSDTEERIAVAIPASSTLTVVHSGGDDVTGLSGKVDVMSNDGHITLASLRGDVKASSDDGYIEANNVQAANIALQSNDGHIELRDASANAVNADTQDGHVTVDGLHVTGNGARATIHSGDGPVTVSADFAPGGTYDISTDDGHIIVHLPQSANLAVVATTNDGRIVRDGNSLESGNSGSNDSFTLGGGSGRLHVSSDDGTIEFMTNGAL